MGADPRPALHAPQSRRSRLLALAVLPALAAASLYYIWTARFGQGKRKQRQLIIQSLGHVMTPAFSLSQLAEAPLFVATVKSKETGTWTKGVDLKRVVNFVSVVLTRKDG